MEDKENKLDELIKQNIELGTRLSSLCTHVIQAIYRLDTKIPVDRMDQFSELLQKPLKVDDKNLISRIKDFHTIVNELSNLDVMKSLGELKFIGKKIHAVEEKLDKLIESGTVHNVGLEFKVDGYTLVKRPLNYDKTERIEPSYHDEETILAFGEYPEDERDIVRKFLGICGREKRTFKRIAIDLDKGKNRVSQIYHKFMRIIAYNKKSTVIKKSLNNLGKSHPLYKAITTNPYWNQC